MRLGQSVTTIFFVIVLNICLFAQQHLVAAEPSAASTHVHSTAAGSGDAIWEELLAGNHRFVSGISKTREFVELRKSLEKKQEPKVIVLGCSDSRVSPELLFDKSLGDLFVVRSAGNIADAIGIGSIEYAVEHLGSSVLVVLGHDSCGAVTASCGSSPMPTKNLEVIGGRIAPACYKNPDTNGAEALHSSVVNNVNKSAEDLLAGSEVLRHAVHEGHLTVIRAVYHLDTGEVVRVQ